MSAGRNSRAARLGEDVEQADVGDQHAAHAGRRRAARVGEALDDLLLPARGRGDRAAGRAARHAGGVPGGVRPREEADLDGRRARHRRHLGELGVGEHEDARALRGAVHAHVEALGRLEQRLEAARPLAARDLDAVARAVGEALGRLGQRVEVAAREPERFEEGAAGAHRAMLSGHELDEHAVHGRALAHVGLRARVERVDVRAGRLVRRPAALRRVGHARRDGVA